MKVLIVCSGTQGILSPFIKEQMDSLTKLGVEFSLFQINRKGFIGYLLHLIPLKRILKKNNPDLIHAHYGLSGLLSNLQRRIPVITTFHGLDINNPRTFKFSKWTHKLTAASIFVEETMQRKVPTFNNSAVIPCGVDITVFYPMKNANQKKSSVIKPDCINILFSSSFSNPIKNYPLAKDACICLERKINKTVNLIELKGYDRQQVNLLINSVDCALITSFSEGSPQFLKEAMACNCPIVSTNVGDIKRVLGNTVGCYIASFKPEEVVEKIKQALDFGQKTNGRERIIELGLDSESVAKKIINVYHKVLNK
jgi:glycosyltransferase involved in cell wall biosynthesis